MHIFNILVGSSIACLLVLVIHHTPLKRMQYILAVALSVAAAIYVGFVLIRGAPVEWFLVETGGFILFSSLAFWAYRYSPCLLALAWFAHIVWDTLLHSQNTPFVPLWYPSACIGFDLVVGAYVILMYRSLRNPGMSDNG